MSAGWVHFHQAQHEIRSLAQIPEAETLEQAVKGREEALNRERVLRSTVEYVVDEMRLWEPSTLLSRRLVAVCQAALDETEKGA